MTPICAIELILHWFAVYGTYLSIWLKVQQPVTGVVLLLGFVRTRDIYIPIEVENTPACIGVAISAVS